MDEQRLIDTDIRKPVLVPFFGALRALALFLYGVAFLLVLYLFVGTDAYWPALLPILPGSIWEATAGTLVFVWFLANATALLGDGGNSKKWLLFVSVLAVAQLILSAFFTSLFLALPGGWFFPGWVSWLFCVALPVMSFVLSITIIAALRKPETQQRRPRLFSLRYIVNRLAVVSAIALALSVGYWYYERPTYKFPDMDGSILFFARERVLVYSLRNGISKDIDSYSGVHLTSFPALEYFCMGPGDTIFIGADPSNGGFRFSFCAYVPFKGGFLTPKRMPPDSVKFSNVDYLSSTDELLLNGTLRGRRGLFLVDPKFRVLGDFTGALNILDTTGWPQTKAYFLDSVRLLLDAPGQCDLFNTRNSSRTPLAKGQFRALSPDRQKLIVTRGGWYEEVHYLIDISTGAEELLKIPLPRVHSFVFSPDSKYLMYSLYRRDMPEWTGRCYIYDLAKHTSVKTPLAYADAWITKELDSL